MSIVEDDFLSLFCEIRPSILVRKTSRAKMRKDLSYLFEDLSMFPTFLSKISSDNSMLCCLVTRINSLKSSFTTHNYLEFPEFPIFIINLKFHHAKLENESNETCCAEWSADHRC